MQIKFILFFLFLWLLMPATSAFAQSRDTVFSKQGTMRVIPFDYDPRLREVVISVEINGQSFLFTVDTGSSTALTLNTWAAAALKLKPVPTGRHYLPGNLPILDVRLRTFRNPFTGREQHNVPADVCNIHQLLSQPLLAGILGAPIIASAILRFDFAAKTITVFDQYPPSPPGQEATRIPLTFDFGGRYFVPVCLVGGASTQLLLDTGSDHSRIPLSQIAGVPSLGTQNCVVEDINGTAWFLFSLLLPSLKIGGFTESNVDVTVTPPGERALLGLDLLSRFRVTLNLSRCEMLLERASDYNERIRILGELPLTLTYKESGWFVQNVEEHSEAEHAGLHKGDRLLAIDGHLINTYSLQEIRRWLRGFAEEEVDLTVEHAGGQQAHVRCKRESNYEPLHRLFEGLIMKKPQGQCLTIVAIVKGTPAERSKCRIGDKITTINGQSTDRMTAAQVFHELQKEEVNIQIERVGWQNGKGSKK